MSARFTNVSCSQCGQEFGPGNEGYSHYCSDHSTNWERKVVSAYAEGRKDEREEIEAILKNAGFALVVAPSGHQFLLNIQDDQP